MNKIIELARPEIRAMTPYSSARREKNQGNIFLNANENPWSLGTMGLNRYPDPQPPELVKKLTELYSVTEKQLLVMRGSDEAIDLLVRLFCRAAQDAIMITPPTYGMYKISAQIQNTEIISVPLIKEQNFNLDTKAMIKAWKPNIKLIFLCSPNNPTGNLLAIEDIEYLCQQLTDKAIIVVDEAYLEFSSGKSCISLFDQYPNLIVLRTLSKAYGLAGVRCGCVLANPDIIQLLQHIIAPYPVSTLVAETICQHLRDENKNLINQQVKLLKKEREKLSNELKKLSFVHCVWPSEANFILLKVKNADVITDHCDSRGIIIRNRSKEYELENCVRITIGTPEENETLLEVLKNA